MASISSLLNAASPGSRSSQYHPSDRQGRSERPSTPGTTEMPPPSNRNYNHKNTNNINYNANSDITEVKVTGCQPKGDVNFPPFEPVDEVSLREMRRFRVAPVGRLWDNCRHVPYNSDKRTFFEKTGRESLEVFQYSYWMPDTNEKRDVLWDYNIGLVRTTPFFKSLGYSKTMPNKMLDKNKGLKDISHSITGGSTEAQGYWIPYSCAKAICATFCHDIAGALIPLFGPQFPSECVPPHDARYKCMTIDPAIVTAAEREATIFKQKYGAAARQAPGIGQPQQQQPQQQQQQQQQQPQQQQQQYTVPPGAYPCPPPLRLELNRNSSNSSNSASPHPTPRPSQRTNYGGRRRGPCSGVAALFEADGYHAPCSHTDPNAARSEPPTPTPTGLGDTRYIVPGISGMPQVAAAYAQSMRRTVSSDLPAADPDYWGRPRYSPYANRDTPHYDPYPNAMWSSVPISSPSTLPLPPQHHLEYNYPQHSQHPQTPRAFQQTVLQPPLPPPVLSEGPRPRPSDPSSYCLSSRRNTARTSPHDSGMGSPSGAKRTATAGHYDYDSGGYDYGNDYSYDGGLSRGNYSPVAAATTTMTTTIEQRYIVSAGAGAGHETGDTGGNNAEFGPGNTSMTYPTRPLLHHPAHAAQPDAWGAPPAVTQDAMLLLGLSRQDGTPGETEADLPSSSDMVHRSKRHRAKTMA